MEILFLNGKKLHMNSQL